MFKLVISFIISVQAIQYYQDTGDAASNSTFDLANDYYCFCDLYKNISDLNCCCDPDKTNVDDQSCLVGSLKKSCFKQYIIFNQNVDKWVQVQQDNEKHELCLIYDANQPISTFITTFTSLDTTFYQDYMFNQFIPQYKPMRLDQKIVNNSWLERTYPEFYLYPDSNGICKLIKQRIDHKPMNKIRCTFAYTTSCAIVDFLGNTVTPKYVDNGNYIYSATTNTDGCIDNIRYEYAYDSLVSRITPDYVNAFLYTKTQNIYTNSQTTYTSGLNRYKSISSEVIFFNSLTNQFYNGQEGYKFGQNVPGSLTGVAFTKLGFPVYKGKQNYEVDCSTYNSSNTILDPRSYETLQFGKNVQYSCRKQMTLAECSTTTLDSLQLFHSFPIGNGTIRLSKKPLYATSLPASDMVFSNQIGIPQISSTTSTCTLQTTQLVLIYYDQYGYQGARQKYIQNIQVGYKDARVIPDSSDVYFRVVVKFIQLTYDEIENSLPQDPSFIPQLPSDIFFPIWYDSWGMVPQVVMILLLFCNY